MANTMRWRYGDTNPVMLPVSTNSVVEIGDLVYLDTGTAKPATDLAHQGTFLLNQHTFQDSFVGVAMQASPAGEADAIRIATSGVFEFDADSSAYELGEQLGCAENSTNDGLLSQSLALSSTIGGTLGRCAKQKPLGVTRALIDIVSTVMKGGAQDPA